MSKFLNISDVVNSGNCVSCGLCIADNEGKMKIKNGIPLPQFSKSITEEKSKELLNICPGKGYNIVEMANNIFPTTKYDYQIGHYLSFGAAKSFDKTLLKNSTSGAMMPTVAKYLLKNNIVQGILTVKFEYTVNGPIPKPFIATSIKELISAQGSKYMPIPLLEYINDVLDFEGYIAVIGTPCQIAGIRLMQKENKILKRKIKLTIANFCGGYRDFRETERIFEINNIEKKDITFFSFRGKGQPGFMTVRSKNKTDLNLPYPNYSRLTGYMKHKRCKLCVDATGELADLSFGDAWLNKFLSTNEKWSFYISRSKFAEKILKEMLSCNKHEYQSISINELKKSQYGNLITKKERQNSRFKLYKFLMFKIPNFDGGYNIFKNNLMLEIKVFITQIIMFILERMKLYLFIAKIIKRK